MSIFRHHHDSGHDGGHGHDQEFDETAYDAQADLALPSHEPPPDTAFAPYAGMVTADEPVAPGYDISRDIAD